MNGPGELELTYQQNQVAPLLPNSLSPVRIYQKWPGKNHFFFFGHLMTGPSGDIPRFLLMNIGLCWSGFSTFILLGEFLWVYTHPLALIMAILFFGMTYLFAFLCSFTDPGIIPRKSVFEMSDKAIPQLYNKKTILETLKNKFPNVYNDEEHNYIIVTSNLSNDIYIFKYCATCEIFRPPKSSHCKVCDNCIEVFDHHCPYLWNCIGKRNYKFNFDFSFKKHGIV